MWHANDGMGWWMIFGGALWLLFWASVVYLFVATIIRPGHHHDHRAGEPEDAMDIARRRLASGDITPEQFQEIRRHLDGRSGPAQQT